ncbi:MAG: DUF3868 domain-containing protein [Bacteroidales bacterium]|nr:DUF3868 domain-containing protein [Bacteroidales bacterium]
MKKKIYMLAIVFIALFDGWYGRAQESDSYRGQVRITPNELAQFGDSVYVNLTIGLKGFAIRDNTSLMLIPKLVSPDREMELPGLLINGHGRNKAYLRANALQLRKGKTVTEPHMVVVQEKDEDLDNVEYNYVMPFEDWMREAHLDLIKDDCLCGGAVQHVTIERLVNRMLMEYRQGIAYDIAPLTVYIRPKNEKVKQRHDEEAVLFDFPPSQSRIIPELGNNMREMYRLVTMIKKFWNDQRLNVVAVEVVGYASPEGSLELNERLAIERAQMTRDFLITLSDLPDDLYVAKSGGEDWDMLASIFRDSMVDYKKDVLYILEHFQSAEMRKFKLRALPQYQQILRDIFPMLRRVSCQIQYTVRNYSTEEAKEMVLTQPKLLSLEEMFRLANTYEKTDEMYSTVFETAVKTFPNNEIANLNAAAVALDKRDLEKAEEYLNKADNRTPEYFNNLGVLYMLREEFGKSREMLMEAKKRGVKAADHNLLQLKKAQQQYIRHNSR